MSDGRNYMSVQRGFFPLSFWRRKGLNELGGKKKVPTPATISLCIAIPIKQPNIQVMRHACAVEVYPPACSLCMAVAHSRFLEEVCSPRPHLPRFYPVNTEQRAWKNPTTTINHSGRTRTASPLPHLPLSAQTTTWAAKTFKGRNRSSAALINLPWTHVELKRRNFNAKGGGGGLLRTELLRTGSVFVFL